MPSPEPFLPYGRQMIDEEDIAAVVDVLGGDWLTTGPAVKRFERAFADRVGQAHAVATSNGTTALHAAMHAIGVGPGDEVVVPALTFAATANAAVYQGATPVFVDVDDDTLLMDPGAAAAACTSRTKAIVPVDYAGQPCDYPRLRQVAADAGARLVSDACHSLGGALAGATVGSLADLTCFSFHPVKPITTGEGGMVVTDDPSADAAMRRFRNHGLTSDHRQRAATGSVLYDMVELGGNHRLSDIHAALGTSQLRHLDAWTRRRGEIAARYRASLAGVPGIAIPSVRPDALHAYHLFVVRIQPLFGRHRDQVVKDLRLAGIGANVHYKPVHLHTYYQERFGTRPGDCPVAEHAFDEILSLPIFPRMTDTDVDRVVDALRAIGRTGP